MLKIRDPLYGLIELPEYLLPFLSTPEFRRLGGVRLLNFESLELAALSEVRRRSHTLGVLHLGTRVSLLDFGPDEVKALLLAIVMHDIGTPPFGHTLEYEYIRRHGRDHEETVTRILNLEHHLLGADHQVFDGRVAKLPELVKGTGCEEIIRSILLGDHPLSNLVFGDIDLDNIDNVFRMSWYLGLQSRARSAVELSAAIDLDRSGRKFLPGDFRPLVEQWLDLRGSAYGILLNSPRHRQNQAVFSRIVFEAMEQDAAGPLLSELHWFETDEQILSRLQSKQKLKPFFDDMRRPNTMPEVSVGFTANERINRAHLMRSRDELSALVDDICRGGVFYVSIIPYGETIGRRVHFTDRITGEEWSVGKPRLDYKIYVHIGAKTIRMIEVGAAKRAVLGKVEEYVEQAGWNRN